MAFDPARFEFDPENPLSWPHRYREALDPRLGEAPVRTINRIDHRGVVVWDVWDMRPVRLGTSRVPKCVAVGVDDESQAMRLADDALSGRESFAVGGRRWAPRAVRRVTEGGDG